MKNYYNYLIAMLFLLCGILQSCSKDFITLEPKGEFVNEFYYQTPEQARAALVSIYDVLKKNASGFDNMIVYFNAASDDNFAGGGSSTDGVPLHALANYTLNADNVPGTFWNDHYQGIFRANILIEKLPQIDMDEATKSRYAAEAKTLRGLYYFNLVRMFKNIPLILQPLTKDNFSETTQASPEDIYVQIGKDLTEAIPDLPQTIDNTADVGRLTKGAAQALLGKVYLYQKKMDLAAQQFAEVNGTPGGISKYGYKLLANFGDLWDFKNSFNTETILGVNHSNKSNNDWGFWGGGNDEGNAVNQMIGPRSLQRKTSTAPDVVSGWGFNIFTTNFYNFMQEDPRLNATVFNIRPYVTNGSIAFEAGDQNTDYFIKKFMPTEADKHTGGGAVELNYTQMDYIIRLADTYLMEAEALGASGTRAQALLDAIRARVGLPSVPVSLQAIKNERRKELAGEGHRFFDLVRWGDAAAALGAKPGSNFKPGTSEILPIPRRELQGTELVQNPGYE